MFDKMIDASVKFRAFIIIFTAAIASIGLFQLSNLPIDAVPDITNKQVRITTTVSSLSPEQIEKQVTYPIETSLQGIVGLESTRSFSRNGFSQVIAVFKEDTDIYFARNQITERVNQAKKNLPQGLEPQLAPITTGLGEVFMWTLDFTPPKNASEIKIGKAGWQNQNDYLTPEGELLSTPIQKATYLRTFLLKVMEYTARLKGVYHVRQLTFDKETRLAVIEIIAAPQTETFWRAYVENFPKYEDWNLQKQNVQIVPNTALRQKNPDWLNGGH